MKWRDRRQSSNVDDRRSGSSSNDSGGGMPSISTLMFLWPLVKPLLRTKLGMGIVGLGAVAYFAGPSLLSGVTSSGTHNAADDEQAAFIKTVKGDTETVWTNIFKQAGARYPIPQLVLYREKTNSGCGAADSRMGPFYCPGDQKVYIDLSFFDDLKYKYGAGGDFAQAYVIAHEVGHHIQNLEGTLSEVQRMKRQVKGTEGNALQVRVELQADCYAGIWAHYQDKLFNALEPGDLEEALAAAKSIGDDTLQKQSQGFAIPHTFTHGSSKQRMEWFARGVKSGKMKDCQTFKDA